MQYSANLEMERLLNDAARNVRDMLERNRAALDAIVSALTRRESGSLTGEVGIKPVMCLLPKPVCLGHGILHAFLCIAQLAGQSTL